MSSWPIKPLGGLCEVLDRYRKPITKSDRREGPYPYYGAMGVVDYVDGFLFDEPLILLGEDGAKWGAGELCAFKATGKYWVNNHAHIMRPDRAQVLDDWLVYYLCRTDLLPFITGLTVPKLNQERMREIPIPLPPLDEQRRIVAVLDEAFAAIATATANAQKNLANARELFSVSLDTAFRTCSAKWSSEKLSRLCIVGDGNHSSKYPKKSEMTSAGVPFLRSNNIQGGEISIEDVLFISKTKHAELKKGHLKEGDVLFTNRGEIGKVAIVPENLSGANLNSQIAWLRCEGRITPEYLYLFLRSGKYYS